MQQHVNRKPEHCDLRKPLADCGTATHSCNFAAEYTDPINAHLAGNITEWSKIANHISVWDYT